MSLWARLRVRSILELTRLACVLALVALALMSYSVIFPRPLPVILAMSLGHLIGAAAVVCYVLAVIIDAATSGDRGAARSNPPPPAAK
jgi:hypothetical protein